jgi:hypothetical protein
MEFEDDTHDKLVKAYLRYYETHDIWRLRPTVRAYFNHQQSVKQIDYLTRRIRKENINEFNRRYPSRAN